MAPTADLVQPSSEQRLLAPWALHRPLAPRGAFLHTLAEHMWALLVVGAGAAAGGGGGGGGGATAASAGALPLKASTTGCMVGRAGTSVSAAGGGGGGRAGTSVIAQRAQDLSYWEPRAIPVERLCLSDPP